MSEPIESISQGNYILHNIDAKKLYVQEPLFTANSGDAVYVGWRPDETVLYSGSDTNFASSFNTNEPITNFNTIKAYSMIYTDNEYIGSIIEYDVNSLIKTNEMNVGFSYIIDNGWKCCGAQKWHITNNSAFELYRAGRTFVGPGSTAFGFNDQADAQNGWIYKVVGINRKENA